MIKIQVIREDKLSNITPVDQFKFFAGEDRTLAIQFINDYDNSPFILNEIDSVKLYFKTNKKTELMKDLNISLTNKSVGTVTLIESETDKLISGNIKANINYNNGDLRIAIGKNILLKVKE